MSTHHLIMLLCSAVTIGWNSMALIGPGSLWFASVNTMQKKVWLMYGCELLKQCDPHLNLKNFKLVTVIN